MNSRSSSYSSAIPQPPQPPPRRPTLTTRLSVAVSSAERGEHPDGPGIAAEHQIEEEIAEIKRYEDFTTIDWVQDAAREQLRRTARRRRRQAGVYGSTYLTWRRWLADSYEAAQGWIVVTIIGAAIGLNAAFLNIVTEWLSDIKLGHCKTAFYLNENFCCWGEDNGCADWQHWTGFGPANYIIYILFATLFAFTSAALVKSFAPYAAGSGISEIKCIIAGFVMKGFLGFWTLLIKSICLPLAIGSGLSVGKEGPSVHYAVCTGNVISRLFDKYRRNASKTREILSACAAAGVAVAFGSPIGGVLFSLEEMSSHFPLKTLWRSYFCALVATAVLAAMNPFRTGQLVMFQVKYDRSWHFFEVVFYALIGIFGGLYGAFVIKWNLRVQAFRKKYLARYAILEATLLAAATAIVCYPNVFLRIELTESMEILFLECEGAEDYQGLCEAKNRGWNIVSLLAATVIRIFFVIISYGCKVPAGIFVPSMAVGASFGRTVGIVVQALQEAYPGSVFFSSCEPDVPCITPGAYAFLGAGAALSGIMHITISVVVIMFELTGALTYILPTMIVVGVTKAVSEMFGKGGIADRMIWFSGFPFLDNKEEHNFGVPVSAAMTTDVKAIPVHGMTFKQVEELAAKDDYQGFPVVEETSGFSGIIIGGGDTSSSHHSIDAAGSVGIGDGADVTASGSSSRRRRSDPILVGFIGRTELRYAVDRIKREQPRVKNPLARCAFAPAPPNLAMTGNSSASVDGSRNSIGAIGDVIDFSRFVDPTPVTVHPRLPLETVMELFRKIGPRVVLIEHRGRLSGLVTVKDCLKYQFKAEAGHSGGNSSLSRDGQSGGDTQERIWNFIRSAAGWVGDKVSVASGGRIRLSGSFDEPRSGGGYHVAAGGNQILEGTEDIRDYDDDGVELENR